MSRQESAGGFFVVTIGALIIWGAVMLFMNIKFNQNCGGHLTRAANANTVDLAEQELTTAINYLEFHNMTSGYTSILYNTPDEDVGFWYQNLKAAQTELRLLKVKPDLSAMEQSNTLLKLRDTLTDHHDGHENLTAPDGIVRFPNNSLLAVIATMVMLINLPMFVVLLGKST